MKKVLDGFPISMTDFLTLDMQPNRQIFYSDKDQKEIAGGDPISFKLLGKDTRNRAIQMMHEKYQPGADTGEEMLAHSGEECGIVISGEIVLTVGGETRLLQPGEAYYFDSRLPHRFRNLGKEDCVIVSSCTPPPRCMTRGGGTRSIRGGCGPWRPPSGRTCSLFMATWSSSLTVARPRRIC